MQWTVEWLRTGPGEVPALDFLLGCPPGATDHMLGILKALRVCGPDGWYDMTSHCPMKGKLAHLHEIRDKHDQTLYRLFILWDRSERRVVILDGRSKDNNTKLGGREYDEIAALADSVLNPTNPNQLPFATFDDLALKQLEAHVEGEEAS